ncbi:MAG: hypothetical protein BMS9Abin02_1960 [Anaerolineae bacterium]|nr:MAG: hypothetical protein BMS9Abin02_1960 [Anaerolineae bacterium]
MKKKVTLNNKEQKRLLVLNEVLAGRIKGQQTGEILSLFLRYVRRLLSNFRQESTGTLTQLLSSELLFAAPYCYR